MRRNTLFFRITAITSTAAMLMLTLPAWAFAPDWSKMPPEPKKAQSRLLTSKEMKNLRGSAGENPYLSGTERYSVNMWGVDLLTMNYTTSATDLSFEGGYGIPVNVTRTYSANEGDEGPFGKGWILSTDIRTTAGGLLKSSGSGDRSTPVQIKQGVYGEKQATGDFSNTETVAITDASGRETTSKLDVDGILSGPLWDKNIYEMTYEEQTLGSDTYSTLYSMKVTTPEDTVYVYNKQGAYRHSGSSSDDGADPIALPGYTPTESSTPTNILKIASITDRHGNATNFTYTTAEGDRATFHRLNGLAWENRLTQVTMPGGRSISFSWTTVATGVKRITGISDGTRSVTYTYGSGPYYEVASVTSPAGYATNYTYQTAVISSHWSSMIGTDYTAGSLLHTIQDCRGLTTTIYYAMGLPEFPTLPSVATGTNNPGIPTACAYRVHLPNDQNLFTTTRGFDGVPATDGDSNPLYSPYSDPDWTAASDNNAAFMVTSGAGGSVPILSAGFIDTQVNTTDGTFKVRMLDPCAYPNSSGSAPQAAGRPSWEKTYSLLTGDLLQSKSYIYPFHESLTPTRESGQIAKLAGLYDTGSFVSQSVTTDATYNFLGNPLSKTVTESTDSSNPKHVYYAYHGYDKYFQQKAVKDEAGRISYTDYYDRSATDGKKGQVYRVYDPKWSNGFTNASASNWKSIIVPSNTDLWSAEFDYDTDGRPTSVKKLQTVGTLGTSSTYARVQTVTTYGGSGTPFWGAAQTVTEDYGSGKINRVTETISYNVAGKATVTKDAAGKRFSTTYDDDNRVQGVSVDPTGGTSYTSIMSYTYGTSGVSNGMPTVVDDKTDSARTITESIGYASSGYGIGQPSSVSEQWHAGSTDLADYGSTYTYNMWGTRDTVHYSSPNGDRQFHYLDYCRVGSPEAPNYAFQNLTQQTYASSTWSDSDERFFYHFDTAGRLNLAAFAQTRATSGFGSSGWSPPDGYQGPLWAAGTRAVQKNAYDAAGRVTGVYNTWQSAPAWNTNSTYPNTVFYGTITSITDGSLEYAYDSDTGLRTSQSFIAPVSGSVHTESYGYDSNLDYLTSVDYADGLSDATRSWTYDAAGNRKTDSKYSTGSWTYDNLNRMTNSPALGTGGGDFTGWVYQNDILGNRTGCNMQAWSSSSSTYTWDVLGRAETIANQAAGSAYSYRADGQRIEKVDGVTVSWTGSKRSGHYDTNYTTNGPTTRYFYDGTMGVEDDYNPSGTITTVNRYALGARGIDRIENYASSTYTYGYPLYDGHGNMRATLSKSGASYTTSNWRSYDVWGSVRSGGTSGPKQRYCANLGHVADDESGLIYMRARYMEPASGRFISRDSMFDGTNLFVYCAGDPINFVDNSGGIKVKTSLFTGAVDAAGLMIFFVVVACMASATNESQIVMSSLACATFAGGFVLGCTNIDSLIMLYIASPAIIGLLATFAQSLKWITKRIEGMAISISISMSFIPVVAALLTIDGTTNE